jgi:hypothetical protein
MRRWWIEIADASIRARLFVTGPGAGSASLDPFGKGARRESNPAAGAALTYS